MTHSTLTWFSSVFTPSRTDELFLVAILRDEKIKPCPDLFWYDKLQDKFTSEERLKDFHRCDVKYWAYVPVVLDDHEEKEVQSQVPKEK